MTRIYTIAILCLAFVAAAIGQDPRPIEVIGPSAPIAKQAVVFIPINNLTEDEFLAAEITVSPSKGAIAFRVYGAPLVVFQGNESGKFTVSVGRNAKHIEWRKALAEAATYAKAVNAPADFVSRLEKLHADSELSLPVRVGSCVVEVAGAVVVPPITPDPNDPTKPLPPNTKVSQVTYVFEKDQNNVPRPVSFALRQLNESSAGSVVATEFEEDTVTGNGTVPTQYKVALEAARAAGLPALVVQSGSTVVRVVKNPTTEQQVLDAAK